MFVKKITVNISIHAPSRERLRRNISSTRCLRFQSTLPRGSDSSFSSITLTSFNFNPRSLAGATISAKTQISSSFRFQSTLPRGSDEDSLISPFSLSLFQSTLPRGSDLPSGLHQRYGRYFNPRSLAGATISFSIEPVMVGISIHAPSRERQHQNKLLLYSFKSSIFCELAQLKYSKIYFDVRKLIVSHSSLSCEPKLNFMFHITSHRIILHYFYSCQSICK